MPARNSACRGKARHKSHNGAHVALQLASQKHGDLRMVVYEFKVCRGFHIGHPPSGEQKRLAYRRILDLIDRANRPTGS